METTIVGRTLSSNNLLTDGARELFKPCKEAKSFLDSVKKSVYFWV